ncbi:MAG: 23S rRNA (adenine(2503)-C(2))-methyltransferase RlmN [Ruminococcaceae bacterium]|nr:23S rRNA (adenine(2503)-C(2))-methyltransferase RlmN [Oscillospiraceae bacterium]
MQYLNDIKSLNLEELKVELKAEFKDIFAFRAEQIYSWLHEQNVESFDEMTNLSKELRENLKLKYEIRNCEIEQKLESQLDETKKYLFKLNDGEFIESVLMKYKYGYTVCISTQVGCSMKCTFCASTIDGCKRNLTPSEMLSQVYKIEKDNENIKVSRVVLMGMGEPLDNFDNVLKFIELITDKKGKNLSNRNVTISTCGIVPKIYELIKLNPQFTLSISLHAPNDEIRNKLMPVNKKWNVDELLKACKEYTKATNKRISFEYVLIDTVNDDPEHAKELARKLKNILCYVNLIPVNEVTENNYIRSTDQKIQNFKKILDDAGITTTVRRTLGKDIEASCGQLRRTR